MILVPDRVACNMIPRDSSSQGNASVLYRHPRHEVVSPTQTVKQPQRIVRRLQYLYICMTAEDSANQWSGADSNRQLPACKAGTLPIELPPLTVRTHTMREAEREGFEPSVRRYAVHRISNPAPSAARAPPRDRAQHSPPAGGGQRVPPAASPLLSHSGSLSPGSRPRAACGGTRSRGASPPDRRRGTSRSDAGGPATPAAR